MSIEISDRAYYDKKPYSIIEYDSKGILYYDAYTKEYRWNELKAIIKENVYY